MPNYQKILVAIELNEEALVLINKAKALIEPSGEIHLLHIGTLLAEVYPVFPMGTTVGTDMKGFQEKYCAEVEGYLLQLANKVDIPGEHAYLVFGNRAHEIKHFAEEGQYDLLMLGLHEKKGLGRFAGTTANAVMHNAPCNVLTSLI